MVPFLDPLCLSVLGRWRAEVKDMQEPEMVPTLTVLLVCYRSG